MILSSQVSPEIVGCRLAKIVYFLAGEIGILAIQCSQKYSVETRRTIHRHQLDRRFFLFVIRETSRLTASLTDFTQEAQ